MANDLDADTLEELRRIANRLVDDPDLDFEQRVREFTEQALTKYNENAIGWIEVSLASAYLSGIQMQDKELGEMVKKPKNEGNPIPPPRFSQHARTPGEISERAAVILSNYPQHHGTYSWYENSFKNAVNNIELPFRRSMVQNYRDIAALAQQPSFINGDKMTRRQLSQSILNEFADRGINIVQFPSRHKMSIEAFAHREARSYLQDVAVQGQISRATERGYDLVRINQYAGPSPMCAPHQGGVFSLSGNSDKYTALQDVIHDGTYNYGSGIYHDYCSHFQSTYIPGVSQPITLTDDPAERRILEEMGEAKGNRYIYQKRQVQRDIEYQIRSYKRKKAVAMDKSERQRMQKRVQFWQQRQRDHISQYDFLKRNYTREAI